MVLWTKPDHVERLGVVWVMPVNIAVAAVAAGLFKEFLVAHGISHGVMRPGAFRVDAFVFAMSPTSTLDANLRGGVLLTGRDAMWERSAFPVILAVVINTHRAVRYHIGSRAVLAFP